jgi:hypothetical protein
MIKSKARCLILDPNGDFRRINEIDDELWSSKCVLRQKYDIKTGMGKLTLEGKDEFAKNWKPVVNDFVIKTNRVPKELKDEELKYGGQQYHLSFLYKVIIRGVLKCFTVITGLRNCSINLPNSLMIPMKKIS